jgi:hypothetical protein
MVINSPCIGILPKLAKGQAEAKGCRWIDLKELQSEKLSIGVAWDKTRAKTNPAVDVVLKWLLG